MNDYPQTVLELRDQFRDEAACRQYLATLRWPGGFVCPRCQGREAWLTARALYHCRRCHYQASVTAGTLFADTNLPLRLWFEAIGHVTNQKYGASALGMQRILGLGSYHTAWNWLHKLRRARVRPGRDRLAGVVEADEIYIGGPRSGKRGRGAAGKSLVVVLVQETPEGVGRIRLARVSDASAASLESAIKQAVAPGSTVRTDDWKGLRGTAGVRLPAQRGAAGGQRGREPVASGESRRLAAETMVVGDASRGGPFDASGLLLG